MEDDEVIQTLKALLEKAIPQEKLSKKESVPIKAAIGFMSLAVHTSNGMRKNLKEKRDKNLRDINK